MKPFKEVINGIRKAIMASEVREDIAQMGEYVEQFANTAGENIKKAIDPTLSLSGKAADAAKVGETVGQLKEDLSQLYMSKKYEYNASFWHLEQFEIVAGHRYEVKNESDSATILLNSVADNSSTVIEQLISDGLKPNKSVIVTATYSANRINIYTNADNGTITITDLSTIYSSDREQDDIRFEDVKKDIFGLGITNLLLETNMQSKSGNVNYTVDGDVISISGSTTSLEDLFYIWNKSNELPFGVYGGNEYYISITGASGILFQVFIYKNGTLDTTPIFNSSDKTSAVKIPSDATGMIIRLRTTSGYNYNAFVRPFIAKYAPLDIVSKKVFDTENVASANSTSIINLSRTVIKNRLDFDYALKSYGFVNLFQKFTIASKQTNGVTYSINSNNEIDISTVDGGATGEARLDIYNNATELPAFLTAGKWYYVYITGSTVVRFQLYCYTEDRSLSQVLNLGAGEYRFKIPDYAIGAWFRMVMLQNESENNKVGIVLAENSIPLLQGKFSDKYIAEIEDLASKVGEVIDDKTLVFSWVSDTHYTDEVTPSNKLQKKFASDLMRLSEYIGTDFVAHTGDMITDGYDASTDTYDINKNNKRMNDMMRSYCNSFVPFVYTLGHHEMYPYINSDGGYSEYGYSSSKVVGQACRYGRYLDFVRDSSTHNNCYYYIDFDDKNIRVIVLDSSSFGATGFANDVIDFLRSALNTAKSVVVFSHAPTRASASVVGAEVVNNGSVVETVLEEFISNGGTVLGHFHGHTHFDNIVKDTDMHYPLISIACSTLDAPHEALKPVGGNAVGYSGRKGNDISSYCIDVVCINSKTKKINMFRFGVGTDRVIN